MKDNIKRGTLQFDLDRYVTEETRPDPPFDSIQTVNKWCKVVVQILQPQDRNTSAGQWIARGTF